MKSGLTFIVNFGPWAPIECNNFGTAYRLCLGYVSIWVMKFDFETWLGTLDRKNSNE